MNEKTIYEIIGYIALALNIWGNIALTNKSIKGWLIRLFCNIAWVIYSYYFTVTPLLINHVIFAGINILGWYRWNKDINKNTDTDISLFVSNWLYSSKNRKSPNQAYTYNHIADIKSMLKEFSEKGL